MTEQQAYGFMTQAAANDGPAGSLLGYGSFQGARFERRLGYGRETGPASGRALPVDALTIARSSALVLVTMVLSYLVGDGQTSRCDVPLYSMLPRHLSFNKNFISCLVSSARHLAPDCTDALAMSVFAICVACWI